MPIINNKIGGKIYGEGQYGCIFIPSLECKDDKTTGVNKTTVDGTGTIDKILVKSEADNEYSLGTMVHALPLWKNYFIVADKICEPALKQTDPDLDKCKALKQNLSEMRILRMPFGGAPLSKYRFPSDNFVFMDFFKHMLEGVTLLTLFGIVHRDLHQGNILIDDDCVPRIIDFNLSIGIRQDNYTASDLRHQHSIAMFHEPPDSTLVNAIALGYNGGDIIDDIINKKIIRQIQSLLGIRMTDQHTALNLLLKNSKSVQSGDDVAWFKTYWRVVDSWAVGAIFVALIMELQLWKPFQQQWRVDSSIVRPILQKMCRAHPAERIDCVQALAALDPQNFIIRKYAGSWLSKVA